MNWYRFKRFALAPYIRYMRHKERHRDGLSRAMLEVNYYRPTFYRFAEATARNPEILYRAPLKPGDRVLDIGAYVGEWSARVHEEYQPRIDAFEPDPPSLKRLKKRFADNPDIRCFPFGLGRRDADLELVQHGMGSSFHAGDGRSGCQAVKVPVRDIVGVLDEQGLREVALIKLNIEGGEYDVLERLIEAGRMPDVGCFMIQFHEWLEGAHRRRRRIRQALSKTHDLAWDYPFVWEQWIRK